jgi:hypothetical protein
MTRKIPLALLLAAASCSRPPPPSAPPSPPAPATPVGQAVVPADQVYLTAATTLRREPTEASKVTGPRSKQTVSNTLAVLQRGEKATLVESRGEWARVKASDETVGWLKAGLLLPAAGVTEATLLEPADAFDRPDLLAVNAKRKIDPGTLVLVVRARELFSEVNLSSGANAWVLSDRLSTAPRQVNAAKLIDKARWLVRSGRTDEAKAILELARREFADVPLVEVLARDLGELPDGGPTDGGTPPAAVPAPSPSPGQPAQPAASSRAEQRP